MSVAWSANCIRKLWIVLRNGHCSVPAWSRYTCLRDMCQLCGRPSSSRAPFAATRVGGIYMVNRSNCIIFSNSIRTFVLKC